MHYRSMSRSRETRSSVSTKVDSSVNVNYGVQASEEGFTSLVRSLAVQSIQTYPTTDAATTAAGDVPDANRASCAR